MRQEGTTDRGRARNSRADANVSARQPAAQTSSSSDSRTEASESTTKTIGVKASDISYNLRGPSALGLYFESSPVFFQRQRDWGSIANYNEPQIEDYLNCIVGAGFSTLEVV